MFSPRPFCVIFLRLIASCYATFFLAVYAGASITTLLLKPPIIEKLTLSVKTGDDGTDQNIYFSFYSVDYTGTHHAIIKNQKLNSLKSGDIFESGDVDVFTFDLKDHNIKEAQADFAVEITMGTNGWYDWHWDLDGYSAYLNDSSTWICHEPNPSTLGMGETRTGWCQGGGVNPGIEHTMAALFSAVDGDYARMAAELTRELGIETPTVNVSIDPGHEDTTFDYDPDQHILQINTNYDYGPTNREIWYAIGQAMIDTIQGPLSDDNRCLTTEGPSQFLSVSDKLLDEDEQSLQCIFREAYAQFFVIAMTEKSITSRVTDFRRLYARNTCYETTSRYEWSKYAHVLFGIIASTNSDYLDIFHDETSGDGDTCPVIHENPAQAILDVTAQVAANKQRMIAANISSHDPDRVDYPLCGIFKRTDAGESTHPRDCWDKRQIACTGLNGDDDRHFWVSDSAFTLMSDAEDACDNSSYSDIEVLSGHFGLYEDDANWSDFYNDFLDDVEYGVQPIWDDCLLLGLDNEVSYQYTTDPALQSYYRSCNEEKHILCESATDANDLKITNDTYPLYDAARACVIDGNVNGRKKYYYPTHQTNVTLSGDDLPSDGTLPGSVGSGGTKRKGSSSVNSKQALKKARTAKNNADQIDKMNQDLKLATKRTYGSKVVELEDDASILRVYTLDVGAGSCHAIQCSKLRKVDKMIVIAETESVLVDCGSAGKADGLDSEGVKEALQDNDFFKDVSPTIVVTHPDKDHFSYIQRLMLTKDTKVASVDHEEHGKSYLKPEGIYLGGYLDNYNMKQAHLKFKTWTQWMYKENGVPVNGGTYPASGDTISKWAPGALTKRVKTFGHCSGAALDVVTVNHINAAGVGPPVSQSFTVDTPTNLTSAVLKLDLTHKGKNFFSVIMPGDAYKFTEAQIIKDLGAWKPFTHQLLLSPHHGANTSSSRVFLDKVKPGDVIHSSGTMHRHPRYKVVQCIERDGKCDDHADSEKYGGDSTDQLRDLVAASLLTAPIVSDHYFDCGKEEGGYDVCISNARQYTTRGNKSMTAEVYIPPLSSDEEPTYFLFKTQASQIYDLPF